jgi:hypothetical protein
MSGSATAGTGISPIGVPVPAAPKKEARLRHARRPTAAPAATAEHPKNRTTDRIRFIGA